MLAALLIVFREVLEASLIIGIVMASTRGVPLRSRWVAGGVGAGILGATLVAFFTETLSAALEGVGQDIFNASILGIAVAMLAWHNVWMARHGRAISQQFRNLGQAVSEGSRTLLALAIVIAVAVLREGAEIVLFLYGITLSAKAGFHQVILGGLGGLALGAVLGFGTYRGLLKIPSRHLFAVTSWLIALLAAGMAANAIGYLQQAEIISVLDRTAWNTSGILDQQSVIGTLLHALVGYIAQPTQAQVLAYAATLTVIFVLMRLCAPRQSPAIAAVAGHS